MVLYIRSGCIFRMEPVEFGQRDKSEFGQVPSAHVPGGWRWPLVKKLLEIGLGTYWPLKLFGSLHKRDFKS